jgi:hypothetical protein
MKNRNFTKKYTDHKTINSTNCAKFEVNTGNLKLDEDTNMLYKQKIHLQAIL